MSADATSAQPGSLTSDHDSRYTLKEIRDHFGLHYARISRIVRAAEEAKGKT